MGDYIMYLRQDNFLQLIVEKNLNLKTFAENTKINVGTIYKIVNNRHGVSPNVRTKIMQHLKIDDWHHLFYKESKNESQ